jgi:O-acetyl-ADP-ribose deacetylase (regulator of RNase III)
MLMQSFSNRTTPSFQTLFVDENPDVVNALAGAFGGTWPESVRFVVGNVLRNGPGIVATPTNSEGDMSAGLDLQLKSLFPNIEERLQRYIHQLPARRLTVGASVWIETGETDFPFVIFSPTFRTRWDLATPNRVYRASLAVFRSAQVYPSASAVHKLLMPEFGTGVGGVDPILAARKMFQAYCRAVKTSNDGGTRPIVLKVP